MSPVTPAQPARTRPAEPARRGALAQAQGLGRVIADRPKVTAVVLAVVGLAVRQAWLTTRPLAAGDWHWPSRGRLLAWFPWPTIWDSTLGFGGENRFLEAFRLPVFSLSGAVAALGGNWTLAEKVVYFLPFAVVLPITAWLLAREILGPTRWTLLAPAILLGNTYFTLETNGHVPLPLGELIGCLALIAFIRALRRLSPRWAILAGLLVSAAAVGDVRAAYITVLMMVAYLAVLVLVQPTGSLIRRRIALGAVAGGTFVGTQMYWIVPLLTYHGHPGFPTPQAPNFNIITLGHAITGVAAGWSGGDPAPLVQAPLNPWFMVFPLLAMVPLVMRKARPELLWLALVAVIFAFLAKTNTPPLGGVYNFLYLHVPGFRLFREGSKFLFPVGVAYAVLVPAGLQMLFHQGWRPDGTRTSVRRARWVAGSARVIAVAGLSAVLLVATSVVLVLESGKLGSSTTPTAEPLAFKQMDKLLSADHTTGSVLWFGQPLFNSTGDKNHRYLITSKLHPAVNLTGNFNSTLANQRDDFQYYCPTSTVPYCYVQPGLFPYLVGISGSSYIVSPGSSDLGSLPSGITRSWLKARLTSLFGPPMVLGKPGTTLLVWKSDHVATIAGYPAVAAVDSGPWSTGSVLPALQAMGIPAVYRQSFSSSNFPAAPAGLPDSVGVVPYLDGGYRASDAEQVGLMARTGATTVQFSIGGSTKTLALLGRSGQLPDWGVYGPVSLPAGSSPVTSAGPAGRAPTGLTLGPAVAWSALTQQAFAGHSQPIGTTRVTAGGERLSASVANPATWTVLARLYDPGWRVGGRKPLAPAQGLFNLYHSARVSNGRLTFTFSTMPWERRGQILALAALALALLILLRRSRTRRNPVPAPPQWVEGRLGQQSATVGLALLGITAVIVVLQWAGFPTKYPQLTFGADPYTLEEVTGFLALVALAGSILLRLGRHAIDQLRAPATERARPAHVRAAVTAALCLVAASCTGHGGSGANALAAAQVAGAPRLGAASRSLDDAQLLQAARQPHACITNYTAALRSFPKLASAYTGRAACYLSGAISAPAAVHDDTRVVSLTPGDALAYLQLAGSYRAIGNFARSTQEFARAASLPSASPGDVLVATDGTLSVGTVNQARAVVDATRARFADSAVIEVAASDVALAADDGTATSDLTRALSLAAASNEQRALVLGRLCRMQTLTQDYSGALTSCAGAAQLATNGSGAWDDLAAANAAIGNLSAAIQDLTAAIGAAQGSAGPYAQVAGVDGFGLATLYEARGRLEVEARQTTRAIADYQRARDSLPGASPDFRARLKADIRTARLD